MITDFIRPGKASFIVGGQFGSEGKGAAAAWLAVYLKAAGLQFDVVTTNAGAQAGHTSVHGGIKRVCFHLPTAPVVVPGPFIYLNAGSIIDPVRLERELGDVLPAALSPDQNVLCIHPHAAVITPDCVMAEEHEASAQTRIASTRKGVGEALARKVLRSGMVARNHSLLHPYTRGVDPNRTINDEKWLVEVPQGLGLGLNAGFYPHTTSRDCTVAQAASDANLHPHQVGQTMLVLRTYPIRVGNIIERRNTGSAATLIGPMDHYQNIEHSSGGCYFDQKETSWEDIGQTPEITTVTGRIRRVFTWSQRQLIHALASARPSIVFLTHCDYVPDPEPFLMNIYVAASFVGIDRPAVVCSFGPSVADARIMT